MDIAKLAGVGREPLPFSGRHSLETLNRYKKRRCLLSPHRRWTGGQLGLSRFVCVDILPDTTRTLLRGLEKITAQTKVEELFSRSALSYTEPSALRSLREAIESSTSNHRAFSATRLGTDPFELTATRHLQESLAPLHCFESKLLNDTSKLGATIQQANLGKPEPIEFEQPLALSQGPALKEILAEQEREKAKREARHQAEQREYQERLIEAQKREWHETWWFKAALALGSAALGVGFTYLVAG